MLGYADARRLLLPSAVHAFIFLAIRIPPFLALVDREVDFCVLTIYSFSATCWAFFFFFFFFFVRKNPSYRDSNEKSRPNVSEGYEVSN